MVTTQLFCFVVVVLVLVVVVVVVVLKRTETLAREGELRRWLLRRVDYFWVFRRGERPTFEKKFRPQVVSGTLTLVIYSVLETSPS